MIVHITAENGRRKSIANAISIVEFPDRIWVLTPSKTWKVDRSIVIDLYCEIFDVKQRRKLSSRFKQIQESMSEMVPTYRTSSLFSNQKSNKKRERQCKNKGTE